MVKQPRSLILREVDAGQRSQKGVGLETGVRGHHGSADCLGLPSDRFTPEADDFAISICVLVYAAAAIAAFLDATARFNTSATFGTLAGSNIAAYGSAYNFRRSIG
jgi:hypothetical protein